MNYYFQFAELSFIIHIIIQLLLRLQRFYTVKPCSKEMKCDVEVSTYDVL